MREIVELIFSLVEGFFEFNSDDKKISKRVKKAIKGIIIFLLLMTILIIYITLSHKPNSITS